MQKKKEFDITRLNLNSIQNELQVRKEKSKKIQSYFDFAIPDYVIDEIIDSEDNDNRENLYCIINCAIINGKITQENARRIKEIY